MYKKLKNDKELDLVIGGLYTPTLKNKNNFFVPREDSNPKNKNNIPIQNGSEK